MPIAPTSESDFLPATWARADAMAVGSQRAYYRTLASSLTLLLCAAALSAVHPAEIALQRLLSVGAALAFALSLGLSLIARSRQYDAAWFRARSVAESIKSLAWKYACRAEPFAGEGNEREVDALFAKTLHGLADEIRGLPLLGAADRPEISNAMRTVRAKTTESRRRVYVDGRLLNQRVWYDERAQEMEKKNARLFFTFILINLIAACYAILRAAYPAVFEFDALATLAAVSAAVIAWSTSKRFGELSLAYAAALVDLGLAAEQFAPSLTDHELGLAVADAESAISREHTRWAARRHGLEG